MSGTPVSCSTRLERFEQKRDEMAGQASEYHRGEMDIHEQVSTFHLVMNITKWGALLVAVGVLTATLWFCTGAGFMGGAITGAVVLALGIVFLREKPAEGH
ncbi:MAG TPA: aa3-type cytochrome c oxidase subunit IV [Phenylobacterium sp.]|uniref:aa3-type cytochrome c oxidase subunit IV n=1 Tax=Phenylobacterium sp. TaxID=1871053 RepID=UPI002C61DD26|nr:aa3-type cytochrome c oxidase subunit IV [Phenylobacterium sp.]HXA38444.1 aa3-type cytochrome c oxidase subunit IV [Phenylobacterium sp.]